MNRIAALHSRSFRIFWLGQFASLIGTWIQNTVQPYLAYQLTGQPLYLGMIGFAVNFPTLLLAIPAGVWVERMDKRRVVMVMQAVMALQALALGVLALSAKLTIWHIIALAPVLGAANAIEITARQVMIPELVPRAQLPNALALNAAAFNLARIIGPSIAGALLVLIQGGGEGWAFVINAASYGVVLLCLTLVRPLAQNDEAPARRSAGFEALRDGQTYIRRSTLVRTLIVMASVTGFFGFPVMQQVPVLARDVLGLAGEAEAAVAARNSALVGAVGIGALAASVLLTLFSTVRSKGAWLTFGQFVFGAAVIALAFSRTLPAAVLAMMCAGIGMITANNLTNQVIQLTVPPSLRSRVFSTYLWALQGLTPFGSLAMGYFVQQFGAPVTLLVTGAVCLLSPLIANAVTAEVRRFKG